MYVNLILFPFVIGLGLLLSLADNKRNRCGYIIACCAVFLFFGAFGSADWFTATYRLDTLVYKYLFEQYGELSWSDCFNQAYLRYVYGGESDIGFVVLNKAFSLVTKDFYIYSLLIKLLFFIPFGIVLYRLSSNMLQLVFAFVFYIALIQVFIFGSARQMFTIGFDLIALLAVIDRRKWWAILFFLLGVTIHYSSFIFVVPLLMVWFDVNPRILKWAHALSFLVFPFVLAFPNQIIVFMGEAVGVEKYANYGMGDVAEGTSVFILLIEFLSLFILLLINRDVLLRDRSVRICYAMTPFFTLFAPLLRSNGAMIRLSLYFHIFLALLIPYAIDCKIKKKDRLLVYLVAIGSFIAFSGKGMEYYFYWNDI